MRGELYRVVLGVASAVVDASPPTPYTTRVSGYGLGMDGLRVRLLSHIYIIWS